MKPIFAQIAASGSLFIVNYEARESATNCTREGYSIDTFRECPDELPALDLRPADVGKVIRVIMEVDGIQERDRRGIPAREYAERMRWAGGIVTTVGALRQELR